MWVSAHVQPARTGALRSRRRSQPSLLLVNATELFDGLAALPGSLDAGATNGISASRLVNGVEYAHAAGVDERRMRAAWKRRRGGGAVPLLLIGDDPADEGQLRVLGPQPEGPVRKIRAESLFDLISRTEGMGKLEAVRQVAQEVERLDIEGVAGLAVRGLGSEHLYAKRLPQSARWEEFKEITDGLSTVGWREVLSGLGYEVAPLPKRGYLASSSGEPLIVVYPRQSADQFARLDEAGRLPEGALVTDCLASGAPYGLPAAGARMRLLRAGHDEAGSTTRYLELDPAAMEPDYLPLVGLLAPAFLASGGLENLLVEARDYGSDLRKRLDRSVREDVLPVLGRELGRWAIVSGRDVDDDDVRAELEAAALTWIFRALFLLYAESAGHLPMSNHTYAGRSFTRIAERAAEELDVADRTATTFWRDIGALVDAMRTGQSAWGVPAYESPLVVEQDEVGASGREAGLEAHGDDATESDVSGWNERRVPHQDLVKSGLRGDGTLLHEFLPALLIANHNEPTHTIHRIPKRQGAAANSLERPTLWDEPASPKGPSRARSARAGIDSPGAPRLLLSPRESRSLGSRGWYVCSSSGPTRA